jgi:hypothetical protein
VRERASIVHRSSVAREYRSKRDISMARLGDILL